MIDEDEKKRRDKETLAKMQGAQQAMKTAIDRISELETKLRLACSLIEQMKEYVPTGAYRYRSEKRLHDEITEQVAHFRKYL